MNHSPDKPVVALTLGDPAGIGPELIARLLSRCDLMAQANVVLVGDAWLWEEGQRVAGLLTPTVPIASLAAVRRRADPATPAFVGVDTVQPQQVHRGRADAAGGASVLAVLDRCMDAALAHEIDAICFAPLNKHAMKQGGLRHEDELHHFAAHLGVTGYFCEFNTLHGLWTSRISSHVPLKDVPKYLDKQRVVDAATLIYRSLQADGVATPRVAVAGFNPHNGDGGTCGREEIDTIVTMYHDQGQIAIKLMGFSQGVTVQGGLPIPITTPAHGTAYDIAGLGKANVDATANAFAIACRMGHAYRDGQSLFGQPQ
jgi:4-hydroxythreonine-4-phosphate dehydrogenase